MSSQTNVVACLKLECHDITRYRLKAFFYVSLQKLHVGLYFPNQNGIAHRLSLQKLKIDWIAKIT